MVRISQDEKDEDLREATQTDIKNIPHLPYIKGDELAEVLNQGLVDFIATVQFWGVPGGEVSGVVREIEPWGPAQYGFHVRASSIDALIDTVNAIVNEHRPEGIEFLYFQCKSPEMPLGRTNHVERDLALFRERVSALQSSGLEVPDHLYDY